MPQRESIVNKGNIPKSRYRRMNKAKLKQDINLFYNLSDLPLTNDMKNF